MQPLTQRYKGVNMNNILFFLTPKAMCAYVYDDYTIRQALEKMESAGYAALPILNKRGEYRGTLTEGDVLWALKNLCYLDMRQAEAHRIMEIERKRDTAAFIDEHLCVGINKQTVNRLLEKLA